MIDGDEVRIKNGRYLLKGDKQNKYPVSTLVSICAISFKCHCSFMKKELLLFVSPIYRCENRGLKRLRNFPKVVQLVIEGTQILTHKDSL